MDRQKARESGSTNGRTGEGPMAAPLLAAVPSPHAQDGELTYVNFQPGRHALLLAHLVEPAISADDPMQPRAGLTLQLQ